MNEVFSLSRFKHLMTNHLVENKKKYLNFFLAAWICGIVVVILFIALDGVGSGKHDSEIGDSNWESFQKALYFVGFYLFGLIFSINSFSDFNNKGEATFYMIKPASVFEKWLTEIVFRILFFFIVYTIIYYFLILIFHFVILGIEKSNQTSFFPYYPSRIQNILIPFIEFKTILIFSFIVSFVLYGRALFTRFTFFKTLFLAFIMLLFYIFYMITVTSILGEYKEWDIDLYEISAYVRNNNYDILYQTEPSETFKNWYVNILCYTITGLILAASFFKLKEKEI
jgi:hypothetical protein